MKDPRSETHVLHHLGADDDRGGIVSVVRTIAGEGGFSSILGVGPGFVQRRAPPLETLVLPPLAGDCIGLFNLWRARATARAVQTWLHADAQRIFHARSRPGLLVAWWLHGWEEVRFVASVHWFGRQRWFYRLLARRLGRRLIWLGPAMKRYYDLADTGWDGCIPDCVRLAAFSPDAKPIRKDGEVMYGCVGCLTRVKEWERVLHALALLPADSPVRVEHAGGEDGTAADKDYARELRELTMQLGLESRVRWCGPSRDITEFLARIDCLVVASGREASSVAALEALAAGVPVLAAEAAGTRDLIKETDGGWLFRTGDFVDLARQMEELATDGGLRAKRISPEGLKRFSSRIVAAQWADVYRQVSDVF